MRTFPPHEYTGTAGEILNGFMSGDLALQVRALRILASDAFDPATLPTPREQRTFFDAKNCAALLWKIIRGNVLIKKSPFQEQFIAALYPALNAPARYDEARIPAIFAAYWRDADNFTDLRESIAEARIPCGKGRSAKEIRLKCAVPRDDGEFIAGTTDELPRYMVDLDFTMQNGGGRDILDYYKRVIAAIGEDCQIALVSKKTGSYGPIIRRDEIFDFVGAPDTPNVRGAFVYSRRVNAITRSAARGGFTPNLPVLILYDLLATGEDVHEVARALHECCREQGAEANPPVFAAALHASDEKHRNRRLLPHDREIHIGDFDARRYRILAQGAGESARRLSGVIYFHRGDKYMPSAGSGVAVAPLSQSRGKEPFKKFGINTIDPTCAMENKFRVSAIFENLTSTHTG